MSDGVPSVRVAGKRRNIVRVRQSSKLKLCQWLRQKLVNPYLASVQRPRPSEETLTVLGQSPKADEINLRSV